MEENEQQPMQRINTAGEFRVTIRDPYWEKLEEKNGDKSRMALVLRCVTDDGFYADHRLNFTRQVMTSGKNAGKPLYEVSAEDCHKLGMSRPFNPANAFELDGKAATLVTEMEEYPKGSGKMQCRTKWLNNSKPAMPVKQVCDLWGDLTGQPVTPPARTAPATDPDEMPF